MGIVFLDRLDDNGVQNKTEPKPKAKKDEIKQNNGTAGSSSKSAKPKSQAKKNAMERSKVKHDKANVGTTGGSMIKDDWNNKNKTHNNIFILYYCIFNS